MMVGIRFVCCEICGGLFSNDKTCASHQKWCSGDLSKSTCEYVACDKKLYVNHIQSHMSAVPTKIASSSRKVGRPKGSGNRPKAHASIEDPLLSNGRYPLRAKAAEQVRKIVAQMNAASNAKDTGEGGGNLKDSLTNVQHFEGSETAMSSLPRNGATYNLVLNNNSEITKCSAGNENTLKCTLPITTENSTISKELPNAIANALQSKNKVVLLLTNSSTTQEHCIQTDLSDQNREVDMQALNSTRNLQETLDTRENNDDRVNSMKMVTVETTVKRNRGRPRKERTHIEHRNTATKILNTIKCDVCAFSTKYSGMMSRHKRQAHNNGHLYHCDVCNKSFNHHCKYKQHMGVHDRWSCTFCNKTYTRRHDRDKHIEHAHSEETIRCSVDECLFKTSYNKVLKQHMKTVHGSEDKQKGTDSQVKTNGSNVLGKYVRNHDTNQLYRCGDCSFTSSDMEDVKGHLNKHNQTMQEKQLYYCDVCDYTNENPSSLQRHLLRNHIGVGPWSCDQCDLFCADETTLQLHFKSEHQGKGEARRRHLVVKYNMDAYCRPPAEQEKWMDEQGPECQPKYIVIEYSNREDMPYCNYEQNTLRVDSEHYLDDNRKLDADNRSDIENIYACAICGFSNNSLESTEQHMSDMHNSDENVLSKNSDEFLHDVIVEVTDITSDEIVEKENDMEVVEVVPEESQLNSIVNTSLNDEAISAAVESILHLQEIVTVQQSLG